MLASAIVVILSRLQKTTHNLLVKGGLTKHAIQRLTMGARKMHSRTGNIFAMTHALESTPSVFCKQASSTCNVDPEGDVPYFLE